MHELLHHWYGVKQPLFPEHRAIMAFNRWVTVGERWQKAAKRTEAKHDTLHG